MGSESRKWLRELLHGVGTVIIGFGVMFTFLFSWVTNQFYRKDIQREG